MKKILLVVLALLIVLAGSALWIRRSMGVTDAALLLPAETVILASLPDLPRSLIRWPQTTLAKIGAEPEMKAFLEQPFQYLTKKQGGDEASGVLLSLKPGRIFAAAVSVSAHDAATLIGFQYWGGKIAHDAAIARLRQELAQDSPVPELTHETYQGDEISSAAQMGITLFHASHGQWGFLSNNLAALKDTLDRAAGRKKEGSLASSERYKQVQSHLLKDPDFFFFSQPQAVLDSLLALGQTMGARAIPEQIEQAKKVEAIGAAIKMDGADLRDSVFILRPSPPDVGNLTHAAMKFTTKDTTAYFDFVTDFRQISSLSTNPALAALQNSPTVQNSRLPQLVPEALGPECAVSLFWPAGQLKPEGFLAVQVRDAAKAAECVQEILAQFPETSASDEDGIRTYSFPALQTSFSNPGLALTKDFLLIGLDAGDIPRALQAAAVDPLEKSPVFAPVLPAFRSANEVFGYVDSKKLFEGAFPRLRQGAVFGAAVMPGVSDIIDSSKIPETETIARHLSPIVYSQTRLPDGYLVESSGPITMNQTLILGAVAASPFLKPPATE